MFGLLAVGVLIVFFAIFFVNLKTLFLVVNIKIKTIYLFLLLGAFFCVFFLAMAMYHAFYNIFTNSIYVLVLFISGAAFLFFPFSIVFWTFKLFRRKDHKIFRFCVLGVFVCILGYATFSAIVPRITNVTIDSDKLDRDYKAVLISDLHLGFIYNKNFVNKLAKQIDQIDPDFVLLPGDLIDNINGLDTGLIEAMNKIKTPVYFTFGNHDTYAGNENVRKIIAQTKRTIVQDQPISFAGVTVYGIDDAGNIGSGGRFNGDTHEIQQVIDSMGPLHSGFNIVLSHQPVAIEAFADKGFDLFVAGHTHAGQIFPFNFIVNSMYEYFSGEYRFKDMKVIVSQGLGTRGPTLRLGSRSEIVVIDLIATK